VRTRHIVAWSPFFDTVDEALDHFHGQGAPPVRVVLYEGMGGITGSVELGPRLEHAAGGSGGGEGGES
jgi:hypothetical protein